MGRKFPTLAIQADVNRSCATSLRGLIFFMEEKAQLQPGIASEIDKSLSLARKCIIVSKTTLFSAEAHYCPILDATEIRIYPKKYPTGDALLNKTLKAGYDFNETYRVVNKVLNTIIEKGYFPQKFLS